MTWKILCQINGINFWEARPDRYGNPRVIVKWSSFLTNDEILRNDSGKCYDIAKVRAKKCGFTPCRGRGGYGCFARQCFDVRTVAKRITEAMNK